MNPQPPPDAFSVRPRILAAMSHAQSYHASTDSSLLLEPPSLLVAVCPASSGYSPEPSRHSGLDTSSSAASSTSSATHTTSSQHQPNRAPHTQQPYDNRCDTTMAECTRTGVHGGHGGGALSPDLAGLFAHRHYLPEELVQLTMGFLDLPQLTACAAVNKHWKDLHESDEFWQPMYGRWYGDRMRLNEQRGWKFNFRARDIMLSKLAPAISLLAHPDRSRRVEAVTFLRTHCEFLKFMLPATEDTAASLTTPLTPQQQQELQAVANARPVPPSPMSLMYEDPTPFPPCFLRTDRQPMPGANTLELRHAQHIIKDAIVNYGWRCLFEQLAPRRVRTASAGSPLAAVAVAATGAMDGTLGTSRASSSFPFFPAAIVTPPNDDDLMDASEAASSPSASPSDSMHSMRLIEFGAVLVAWTEYPWLRFDAVSREMDAIAALVESRISEVQEEQNLTTPLPFVEKLQALHHVLYAVLGFKGNESNYYDVRNSFIHCVLLQRTGIPISLAIVYMAVAMRLGITVQGVNSPGHFLLRVSAAAPAPAPTSTPTSPPSVTSHSRRPSRVNDMTDVPAAAAVDDEEDERVFYIDAFSGHMMTPSVTVSFLAMFAGDHGAHPTPPQLQVCSHAALFVRMYRNLMNLYQNPAYHQNHRALATMEPQQAAAYAHYEMEVSLHHCASQVLELMRLSGENTPDVLTSAFIERFRYGGGMS